MREESGNKSLCAVDTVLKPPSVPPEDVVCVINVYARFQSDDTKPVGSLRAVFRRLTGRPSYIVRDGCSGGSVFHENLILDYSGIPRALRIVEDFRGEAVEIVKPNLKFYNVHRGEIETEFWLGRPDQFGPYDGGRLLPLRASKLSPLCLNDQELSAEAVALALKEFYTRETHAQNLERLEQAVENSTVLQDDIRVRRPLRLRK